jgi:hypothetical protein
MKIDLNKSGGDFSRVVYWSGIFWLVSVGISWYLPYRYQRKSQSVHFGIIFLAGTPFSLKKGARAPFSREKGGTGPLFDTASPPFAEKRSSRQTSYTKKARENIVQLWKQFTTDKLNVQLQNT